MGGGSGGSGVTRCPASSLLGVGSGGVHASNKRRDRMHEMMPYPGLGNPKPVEDNPKCGLGKGKNLFVVVVFSYCMHS